MANAEVIPGVVFDCNLFLQAVGKGGNHAYHCLRLVEAGALKLYMSEDCLEEIEEVLRRPELRALFPLLSDTLVDKLIAWLRGHVELIEPVPNVFKYPRDPKDEPYINLAIAAGAVYLVSWDKDIKDLADPKTPDGKRFAKYCDRVRIRDPREFLDEFGRENN